MRQSAERLLYNAAERRQRLQTSVRLRWFAVVGQLIAVGVVYFGLGFSVAIGPCLALIALSAWLNIFLRFRYQARYRLSPLFATVLLVYDTLQLAALLYFTGGIDNPFVVLMVGPVTVSAATLPARNTILLLILAAAVTAVLAVAHWPLPWFPGQEFQLPLMYELGLLAAIGACMTFLGLYAWRLTKEARQMSAALVATELVLAREQKLHALDGLAAAAAHALGTPLATILLVARELERAIPADSPLADDVALLRSQALRCRAILQSLTDRPGEPDPLHANVSIGELLAEAAEAHRAGPATIGTDARPAGEDDTPEPVGERNPGVVYALNNLVGNAVDFARAHVAITARWTARDVVVTIADDGPGFALEVLEALGDPYVTTRRALYFPAEGESPAGLGLGVFIAKTLLERSGATLELFNRDVPEKGALVRIEWPRVEFEKRTSPLAAAAAVRQHLPVSTAA
ncbi:MAG: ActS/PrrB/RegB family redox-sensitive histidine kinase [Hyphomicrobiaceae bacterium]